MPHELHGGISHTRFQVGTPPFFNVGSPLMRVHVLSDLHLEFEDFDPPETGADVVVLAGDINVGLKGIRWAARRFADTPVVYVFGNHEFYGQAYPRLIAKAREAAIDTRVHVLENDSFSLGGVCFLGCTYWTDFELLGDPRIAGYEATQRLTDYRRVRLSPDYRHLRSLDTAIANGGARRWLARRIENLEGEVPVVVTHHAPSARSLPGGYEDDLLSAAYASNHDEVVGETGALLWIHGHVHRPSDYLIGTTRVVCNPRGYPDEPVMGFDPGLVIEIDVDANCL